MARKFHEEYLHDSPTVTTSEKHQEQSVQQSSAVEADDEYLDFDE